MQTALAEFIRDSTQGREADRILRACVHCGFCTATCPTYQLLGDELDGPRGRIYQIKQVLEGAPPSATIREHLDRCLVCRSCETTCPSGVVYHRLLDIGREQVERKAPRPWPHRLRRRLLVQALAYPRRFGALLRLGRLVRPLIPERLQRKIPTRRELPPVMPAQAAARRVLLLEGCVQPGLAPEINHALEHVLARLGIGVVRAERAGCCGAVPHHLSDGERARAMARRNIDAWYPLLQDGADALLITASGCGAHVQDYPDLLDDDSVYRDKARALAAAATDPLAYLTPALMSTLQIRARDERIAVHTPCTLQHALGLNGAAEILLSALGYQLCEVGEGHLCCGSAGTYSILQAELSQQLQSRKIRALEQDHPDLIVSANIGCLMHLGEVSGVPVVHWLNLVSDDLG